MKIVVLDGYTLNPGDLSWEKLYEMGDVKIYDRTPSEKIMEHASDADILFTNKTLLPEAVLKNLPSLKYIGILATGYNVVDLEAARRSGIVVTNVPAYSTSSVAQMTFALILELCLHTQKHSDAVFEGRWSRSTDFCFWDFPLMELSGKTLGIIGFGSIGRKVADIASALDMKIISFNRTISDQSHRKNFRWVTMNELFSESDIVTVHCPLTPDTKGLINIENLGKMKRTALLINTSRGPVVNEKDLAFALNNDLISGVGLDVLSTEPPSADNPLLSAKNCIITPHIAWASKEARTRLMETAISNLSAYLNGSPVNVVNK